MWFVHWTITEIHDSDNVLIGSADVKSHSSSDTTPTRAMTTSLSKLFVGGLSWGTIDSVLFDEFAKYGALDVS